jgi:serine/threonine protein phosphatase PrpC
MKRIKITGVSVIGKSHLRKNIPCQDSNDFMSGLDTGVAVVADGAGSKSHSHIGSRLLTNKMKKYVIKNFDELYKGNYSDVRDRLMNFMISELKHKSYKLKISFESLATTLLFVAIKNGKFIFGHIGDGMIVVLKNNKVVMASAPENGEFANQTFFVHPKLKDKIKLGRGQIDDIEGFVLMTDGCEGALYDRKNKRPISANGDIIKWLQNHREGRVKKALKKIIIEKFRRITGDDCTLAVINVESYKKLLYVRKGRKESHNRRMLKRGMKVKVVY